MGKFETIADAKEYFRQIRKEQNEIRVLQNNIHSKELSLLPSGIRYDKDKVQVSGTGDVIVEKAAVIAEYRKELDESTVRLLERKAEAERLLRTLKDADEREVMRYYYMRPEDGYLLTWEQVAIRMNYYKRHVLRIHGNALAHLVNDGTK